MKFDPTVTIPTVLALCAILSPILVAIINNRHQMKLKKIELKQQEIQNTLLHKRDVIEGYLSAVGRCIHYQDAESIKLYGESYSLALMFLPSEIISSMNTVDDLIRHHKYENASMWMPDIAAKLYEVSHIPTAESK